MQDLTGKVYGKLTVISKGGIYTSPKGIHKTKWLCQCECGNTIEVVTDNLLSGNTTSCGCIHSYRECWEGHKFGDLTVIKEITSNKRRRMLCQCSCGQQKEVYLLHLTSGRIKSCGCHRKVAYEDLTGKTFGYLRVLSENFEKKRPKTHFWNCECLLCGGTTIAASNKLKSGATKSCGCMKSMGERQIIKLLTEANIKYKREYTFPDLKSSAGQYLRFDFAIFNSDNKLSHLIEFQGEQHFRNIFNISKQDFEQALARDQLKREYCKKHSIPLIEIRFDEDITLAKLLVYRSKGLEDESFVQYKQPAMFIANTTCDFKCDRENGTCLCINRGLACETVRVLTIHNLIQRYLDNPITSAVVLGGLEQLDEFDQLRNFITCFRQVSSDPIVIYTGYTESELTLDQVKCFVSNGIIVKFGRFVPGQKSHYDPVLGVNLISDNQYARDYREG